MNRADEWANKEEKGFEDKIRKVEDTVTEIVERKWRRGKRGRGDIMVMSGEYTDINSRI